MSRRRLSPAVPVIGFVFGLFLWPAIATFHSVVDPHLRHTLAIAVTGVYALGLVALFAAAAALYVRSIRRNP